MTKDGGSRFGHLPWVPFFIHSRVIPWIHIFIASPCEGIRQRIRLHQARSGHAWCMWKNTMQNRHASLNVQFIMKRRMFYSNQSVLPRESTRLSASRYSYENHNSYDLYLSWAWVFIMSSVRNAQSFSETCMHFMKTANQLGNSCRFSAEQIGRTIPVWDRSWDSKYETWIQHVKLPEWKLAETVQMNFDDAYIM